MARLVEHVVLIVKENHGFDNYFGTFPGANGMTHAALAQSADPGPGPPPRRLADPPHHRRPRAVRRAGHSRLLCVRQPVHALRQLLHRRRRTVDAQPPDARHRRLADHRQPAAVPGAARDRRCSSCRRCRRAGQGEAHLGQLRRLRVRLHRGSRRANKYTSEQFKQDALAARLPSVSWVYAPHDASEHPPDPPDQGQSPGGQRHPRDAVDRRPGERRSSRAGCGRRRRSSSPGTTGAAGSTTSTRPKWRSGPTGLRSATAHASPAWCSVPTPGAATSRESCTRTSAW